jgi:hypothetical protein
MEITSSINMDSYGLNSHIMASFTATRKTDKAQRTTKVTHQDSAIDTIDNESAAENLE